MANTLDSQNSMPVMGAAFAGWTNKMTFTIITQSINSDGFLVETETNETVDAVFQPLQPEAIELKPDGQRSWKWSQLHVKDLDLKVNDRFTFQGRPFKIMEKYDYSLNGFFEYHVIEDYE